MAWHLSRNPSGPKTWCKGSVPCWTNDGRTRRPSSSRVTRSLRTRYVQRRYPTMGTCAAPPRREQLWIRHVRTERVDRPAHALVGQALDPWVERPRTERQQRRTGYPLQVREDAAQLDHPDLVCAQVDAQCREPGHRGERRPLCRNHESDPAHPHGRFQVARSGVDSSITSSSTSSWVPCSGSDSPPDDRWTRPYPHRQSHCHPHR